jgi:N-acyl-D-aspartate/D-glutamate deacylase
VYKRRKFAFTLALLLGLAGTSLSSEVGPYDIVIANGTVVDGSGLVGRQADVGIRAGKIDAIGDLHAMPRKRTIDARGLAVAPGFIDIHNHSDDTLLAEPHCESMIRQGVTTMVLGEGESQGPIAPSLRPWTTLGGYFDYVQKKGVAANIASYVGETRIWTYVKGEALTPASASQIAAMKSEVSKAMEEGALGLSSSLLMPPSNLITTAQLIELAKAAQSYGGLYSTHIRDEGSGVFRSVQEAIDVAKGANIRVDIIHLKIADRKFWGQMPEVIAMIRKAREEGYDVRANVYPYTAGQNDLRAIIPPWAHDGGNDKMLERLKDPSLRGRIRHDVLNGLPGWYDHYLAVGDWHGMLLVSMHDPKNKPFIGKRMSDVIQARGGDPVDVLCELLVEEGGSVPTVFFHHTERDMTFALKQPFVSVGSDGTAISSDGQFAASNPHPRWYGTFPRVLGRYVREQKVLSLSEAVRKMTSMNAEKINVPDRGLLKAGYWADVTVFDPEKVADRATYENPHQYAVGISYVLVNGEIVLENGNLTSALPGKVLRGPGYRRSANQLKEKS